jgi:hypothetical protein
MPLRRLARATPSPEKARRDARATVVQTVEVGEVLVAEQLLPVQGEETVEGVPSHVVEVGMLATG